MNITRTLDLEAAWIPSSIAEYLVAAEREQLVKVVDDPPASSTWRARATLWLELPVTFAGTPIANESEPGMSPVTYEPDETIASAPICGRRRPPRALLRAVTEHDRREAVLRLEDGVPDVVRHDQRPHDPERPRGR